MPYTFPFNILFTKGLFLDVDKIFSFKKVVSPSGLNNVISAFSPSLISKFAIPKIVLGFVVIQLI